MKTVFPNAGQTIHVWAQQEQSEGRSSNVFFRDKVIYSYGHHYPLGIIVTNKKGEKAAIINNAGYSVTTSKHIRQARYAVNHYKTFLLPDTQVMKAVVDAIGRDKATEKQRLVLALSIAIEERIKQYQSKLLHDNIKRKSTTLEKWKEEALTECNSYIELLDWFGFKISNKASKALSTLTGMSPSEAKELATKAAIKRNKKLAKERAEKDKRDKVAIDAAANNFMKGAMLDYVAHDYLRRYPSVIMRIHGDNIETSQGAQFPVTHAKKAFIFIRDCKENSRAWAHNGHSINLGHFSIDSIDKHGNVVAGCHKVEWQEIERVARILNIYP